MTTLTAQLSPAKARATAPDVEGILRQRISDGAIPPGAKLKETPLAQELGVDRARIRTAFVALERRGLILRIPNQGAVVRTLTAAEVSKIYDVFEILEGLCARLAVENAPPGSWQDLVNLFNDDLEAAIRGGDCERLFDAVMVYRSRTIAAANNPTLSEFLGSIYDKTQVIIRRILILPGRAIQSFDEHKAVIGAFVAGDAKLAERLKRENMRTAREFMERYHPFVF